MGFIKKMARSIGVAMGASVALPFGALSWLEKRALPQSEHCFQMGGHAMALIPGVPGNFARTAYYMMTLEGCDATSTISFGSYFSSRKARIAARSGMGAYCVVGMADIGPDVRIASRVSIVSGLHEHGSGRQIGSDQQGKGRQERLTIGAESWIGEGAVVGADVGAGSIVGVGAGVIKPVPEQSLAMGNPARLIPTATPAPSQPTVLRDAAAK